MAVAFTNGINEDLYNIRWNNTHWGVTFNVDGSPMTSVELGSGAPTRETWLLPKGERFFTNNKDPRLAELFSLVFPLGSKIDFQRVLDYIPNRGRMTGPDFQGALIQAYKAFLDEKVQGEIEKYRGFPQYEARQEILLTVLSEAFSSINKQFRWKRL